MYNDYGSVSRDRDEGSLNSTNFPEFGNLETTEAKKEALFKFAQHARHSLEAATARLEMEGMKAKAVTGALNSRIMAIYRMFCDVTHLHGQLYVVRDIASRTNVKRLTGDVVGDK